MPDRQSSSQPSAGGAGLRSAIAVGVLIIAGFFGGFGGWLALAPLESAAIAPGVLSVESNRKTVQHLEGGIVGEILVRDGDYVRAGQLLIRLDDTQARAQLELLRGRQMAAQALEARLIAERDGKSAVTFPSDLTARVDSPKVREIIEGQANIFEARQRELDGQIDILEQRVAQFSEEIKGLEAQIAAQDTQLDLIEGEIADVRGLVDKGLARKPRLLALQRRQAEILGSRGENVAAIARAKQNIAEARLRMSELRTARLNEVVQELREVQTELFDLAERIRSSQHVLRRTDIRAPLAGTIVGLKVHTPGGVVGPGEPLMDIVPSGDTLILEAQVDPKDIDIVRPGLPAQVRFTALNQRHNKPVAGDVVSVSADRLVEERTGRPYFLARVRLRDDAADILDQVSLYPGMQAEVMIVTGERTGLDYLLRPIELSLSRAFRED